MLLDVVKVKPLDGYVLNLEFENGEQRSFDMSPYIDERPFNRLKESNLFFCGQGRIRHGCLARQHRYCTGNALRSFSIS